ncbi:hypothetical protein CoNPh11_CDS0178 [Staphylococcus phage S-CoN_Ph11]|nr:hypothetical protein CoNPh11_CDS0178 [Staphylococcus phage S-CoN_Ph11]
MKVLKLNKIKLLKTLLRILSLYIMKRLLLAVSDDNSLIIY